MEYSWENYKYKDTSDWLHVMSDKKLNGKEEYTEVSVKLEMICLSHLPFLEYHNEKGAVRDGTRQLG